MTIVWWQPEDTVRESSVEMQQTVKSDANGFDFIWDSAAARKASLIYSWITLNLFQMCIALTKKKNKIIVTLSRLIRRFTMVKSLKPLALVCYGTIIGSCLMVGTTIAATQNKTSGESRSLASALNPLGKVQILKTNCKLFPSTTKLYSSWLISVSRHCEDGPTLGLKWGPNVPW